MGAAIAVAVVALGVFAFLRTRGTLIDGEKARAMVKDGATLIDVRSEREFEAGHIRGARNIPVDEIESRADEVGDRADPVIVYCRSGVRSGRAKRELEGQGFTAVHNLGGMARW